MRRREFVKLASAAAAISPLAARAEQLSGTQRVGVLSPFSPTTGPLAVFNVFGQTLRELGWLEGRNMAFEYRWADRRADRLPGLATELTVLRPDLIFSAWGTPAALAARNATATIPIVFAGVGDAVGVGLVATLSRPGGNVTGSTFISEETIGKQLEFLKEVVPTLSRVGILINPTNPVYGPVLKASEAPALAMHLRLQTLGVRNGSEFDSAFASALSEGAQGLVVLRDSVLQLNKSQLLALAAKHRLPAIYGMSEFAEAGGLMSYGPNLADMYRRAAHVVDKFLRGARPTEVPVEQATRFELVINLRAAKTLGITIPPALVTRAEVVLE